MGGGGSLIAGYPIDIISSVNLEAAVCRAPVRGQPTSTDTFFNYIKVKG